jgi:hypothetical protein
MARRGGLVRLLVTLVLLLLAMLLAAAAAVADEFTAAPAEVGVEHAPATPAHSAFEEAPATASEAEQPQQQPQQHLLPRPLVIELPSEAAARAGEGQEEAPADAVAASLEVEVQVDLIATAPAQDASEDAAAADAQQQSHQHLLTRPLVFEPQPDDVPADVRCASWRLAAEANNLAPWKAVPAGCAAHVRDYVAGAAYRSDLNLVARESAAYARAAPLRGDGRDAWVFDIDETLLSNLPYYAEHGYG